jgi:hypothetical protein
MEVKQIYELVNNATTQAIGQSDLLQEDLGNLVDVGTAIMNANSLDHYVKSLVDHIGKVVFVNRAYKGVAPSVLRDGWEYGAIKEKIAARMPVATENESWELEDGATYDPNMFYKPDVIAKFFSKKTTWEIPMSFTEMQVKSAFSSAAQVNGFISMLFTAVENSKNIKTSELVMRCINNMTAETLKNGNATRAVNLLSMYNDRFSESLTAANAVTDKEFIRFASYIMGLYKARMSRMSTLFNIGGEARFTPADRLHVILLSEFAEAAGVYLQSETWHNSFTELPKAETVPYWQGTGTSTDAFAFSKVSGINVVPSSGGDAITQTGILGVMFDSEALGVCNENQRVTTNYNPKAEFYTNWYKVDSSYFNDTNENYVVFYVAA